MRKYIKILHISALDIKTVYGGAEIQIAKTIQTLKNKYSNIIQNCTDIENFTDEMAENADIIHVWAISTVPEQKICFLKNINKKIIISSIYWPLYDSILIRYLPFLTLIPYDIFIKFIKWIFILFVRTFLYKISFKYKHRRKQLYLDDSCVKSITSIINNADVVIPNSTEEGLLLCKYCNLNYNLNKNKFNSIPNAVDIDFIKNYKDTDFMSEIKDFVIEAAGIEPLKNQLGVLKALYSNPEIPIIFAGQIRDEKYYLKLKKMADKRGNVYFTGKISHDDLFSLYRRAKIHVLVSFRESPGLATLESLMCGSQIVVSNEKYCPIKYYQFDKYGFVCNPYDIKSIRKAILEAYNHPKEINLPEEYIKFFSYENVADMTYKIYKKVLE